MRDTKEQEITAIKQQLTQMPQNVAIKDDQNLTAIRSTQTVQLTSSFTKRKMAVPARDGRDIYSDDQIGPIAADIKSKAPQEQLKQAKNYIMQKKPDYESAIDILQQILKQSPLYTDALVMLS